MELDELSTRLKPFCESKCGTSDLEVFDVHNMPGHAGFSLSLHRRGKRVDATWETTKLSMTPLIDRALELLG